jgi:hypothetical protein
MNYQNIYNQIIENAKSRGLDKKKLEGYFEKHHIIPRCINGTDDKDNLVLLTGREHYLCHHLLWKTNKDHKGLFLAYYRFTHNNYIDGRYHPKLTSKEYELLKLNLSENAKLRFKGKTSHRKDKHDCYSIETLNKMSNAHKGNTCAFGYKHTKEHKDKMKLLMVGNEFYKNRKPYSELSEEVKLKMKSASIKVFINGQIFSSKLDAMNYLKIGYKGLHKLFKTDNKNYYILKENKDAS